MDTSSLKDNIHGTLDNIIEVVRRLIPDEHTRDQLISGFDLSATKAKFDLDLKQVEMNEDANKSPKWRNQLAYWCVSAIAYHNMILPIVLQILLFFGQHYDKVPFDLSQLNQLVYALLGLGCFETAHAIGKSYIGTLNNDTSDSK